MNTKGSGVSYPLGMDMSEGRYQESLDACGLADDSSPGWPAQLDAPEGLWQTQDGTVVRIRGGMSDKHLRNAIQWMRARAFDDHPKLKELLTERKYRGRK